MESRGDHRAALTIAAAFVSSLVALAPAAAQEKQPPFKPPPTVVVYTQPDSAVVEAEAKETVPGNSSGRAPSRRKCFLEPVTTEAQIQGVGTVALPMAPDEKPFWLTCDGQQVGIVMRKITPRVANSPRNIADQLREEIPMPAIDVRANPSIGLVGAESWFWIEGYSGQPITNSTDAFGQPVDVEASVTQYEWSFGDGAVVSSSTPGRAFPERSEVRHTYQRSSAGTSDGYLIQVRFVFAVRYRSGAGAWTTLPGISRTATFRYPVKESQAVISR
jgi:hypothetical protein